MHDLCNYAYQSTIHTPIAFYSSKKLPSNYYKNIFYEHRADAPFRI